MPCPITLDVSATLLLPAGATDTDAQDNTTGGSVVVSANPGVAPNPQCPGEEPEPRPDLAVSAIDVLPREPVQNTAYTYTVYATNLGNTPSGEFTVQVLIFDVDHGSTYPDVPRSHPEIHPGENRPVASFDAAYATCPGRHEIRVEFSVPEGDADPSNNLLVQSFTVLPKQDGVPCD
jgi:hypothetical protein